MSFFQMTAFAGMVATVAAHGYVTGIVAGGTYTKGWDPNYAYQNPQPQSIGWSDKALDLGYIASSDVATPDIICSKDAKNAALSAKVAAGDKIDFQWTKWPDSHRGPVMTYLANCKGDCSTVDKTTLEFFKIDEAGLLDNSKPPGTWASDKMTGNNGTWTSTIPADIAPGNYVVRNEIIALHAAQGEGGAQLYPQCLNLEITGSGTASPAGTPAQKLYTPTDPGIKVDIYNANTYTIPGPRLYGSGSGAASPAAPPAGGSPAAPPAGTSTAATSGTGSGSGSPAGANPAAAADKDAPSNPEAPAPTAPAVAPANPAVPTTMVTSKTKKPNASTSTKPASPEATGAAPARAPAGGDGGAPAGGAPADADDECEA